MSFQKYRLIPVVLLCSVMVLVVCSSKPSSPVIARVGDAVLTLDDLYNSIPAEYSELITHEQNANYVRQWISTELLYQEALRRKVDKEKEIKSRLEKMKKDLLSAEMINRCSAENSSAVSDNAISDYYQKNKQLFVREQNVVKYYEIVVDDASEAQEIRRIATPENFQDLVVSRSKYPSGDVASTPFVVLEAIPPILRQAISAASVPSIIGPVKTEEGYHILRLISKFEKGGIATEEEVRDKIVSQLSNVTQKGEVEKLISELRLKTDVEFNFDLIPGSDKPVDSSTPATVER